MRHATAARPAGREFPVLPSSRLAASPNTLVQFFATTPERRASIDGEGRLVDATELVHAKAMGTSSTLCGKNASSWIKFWDVPFSSILVKACPNCLEVVRRVVRRGV